MIVNKRQLLMGFVGGAVAIANPLPAFAEPAQPFDYLMSVYNATFESARVQCNQLVFGNSIEYGQNGNQFQVDAIQAYANCFDQLAYRHLKEVEDRKLIEDFIWEVGTHYGPDINAIKFTVHLAEKVPSDQQERIHGDREDVQHTALNYRVMPFLEIVSPNSEPLRIPRNNYDPTRIAREMTRKYGHVPGTAVKGRFKEFHGPIHENGKLRMTYRSRDGRMFDRAWIPDAS